jgi:hypothetical protein
MRWGHPLGLLALASVACGTDDPGGEGGFRLEPFWREGSGAVPRSDEVVALWVLRTEDCFTCPGIDREVRRLQRTAAQAGTSLPTVVLHLGETRDSTIVRHFLLEARIDAEIRSFSRREARRLVPRLSAPDLLLVRGEEILWRLAGASGASEATRGSVEALATAFGRLEADGGTERLYVGVPLEVGQLLRIEVTTDESPGEIFGFVGRVGECWAAFHLEPRPGETRRFLLIGDETLRSGQISVTRDAVYREWEALGGDTAGRARFLRELDWIRLTEAFVLRHFTGCVG